MVQFKREDLDKRSPPASFCLSVIAHAKDFSNEMEDSEDEDNGEEREVKNYKFPESWFEQVLKDPSNKAIHPYKIKEASSRILPPLSPMEYTSSGSIQEFLDTLSTTGLSGRKPWGSLKIEDFVGVAICLNRMRSLSRRVNGSLKIAEREAVTSRIKFNIFSTLWDATWLRADDGAEVGYSEVREFYWELKRRDSKAAETFRKAAESNISPPYQFLREQAKNHLKFVEIVEYFCGKNSGKPIYLHLVDFDTIDFNGVYSGYLKALKRRPWMVMTSGYGIKEKGYSNFCEAERLFRRYLTKFIPSGVYFPEPNTCILIPEGSNTVPETFIDPSRGNGMETPVLLSNIFKSRKSPTFCFLKRSPIVIVMPDRFKLNKALNAEYSLSPGFLKGNLSLSDIALLISMPQSHFKNHLWMQNLFINNDILKDQAEITQVVGIMMENYFGNYSWETGYFDHEAILRVKKYKFKLFRRIIRKDERDLVF